MNNHNRSVEFAGICFLIMIILLACAICYEMGRRGAVSPYEHVEMVYPKIHKGDPYEGNPVMIVWISPNGSIYSESAIRTSYSGVRPFSILDSSMRDEILTDWYGWYELDPEFSKIISNRVGK